MNKDQHPVIIIDGQNLAYRAFYRFRELSFEGQPTGALHGFLTITASVIKRYGPAKWIWTWDAGTKQTWRHELDPKYKSNRVAGKSALGDLWPQLATWKRWLRMIGAAQVEVEGVEGDDLVALLTAQYTGMGRSVSIYSADRDFFQLLALPRVKIIREARGAGSAEVITRAQVLRDHGLVPEQWVAWKALIGDAGDGIPQPKRGTGPKGALQMIRAGARPHGSWASQTEAFRKQFGSWQSCWERVRMNHSLVTLPSRVDDRYASDIHHSLSTALSFKQFANRQEDCWEEWTSEMASFGLSEAMSLRKTLWENLFWTPANEAISALSPDDSRK